MSFIQIVDYETDRAAEIEMAMRNSMAEMSEEPNFLRMEQTRDHDNPNHYTMIVEFPDYETAMANSTRPEIDQMARQLAGMCTSGPSYRNLDVQEVMP